MSQPLELRLPRLDRLPCGCSLEMGSRIVGYLHLSGIFSGLVAELIVETRRGHHHSSRDPTSFYLFFRENMYMAYIFTVLFTSAGLLYGIRKRLTDFMEPFLLAKGTTLLADLINFSMVVLARFFHHKDIYIFFELLLLGVESLMFLMVYSYYRDVLEDVGNRPLPEPT